MLQFDQTTTGLLDDAYQGADITARRRANFDALAPRPGEHILDLGCGNGLLTLELSRAVGPKGHVTGLDASADMLTSARARCGERDNVSLVKGQAADLPFEPQSFDAAISLQVFEYFDDPAPALTALRQILKTGGRLVIGDMHWDTLAWHSDHPKRMERMQQAWRNHLAEPHLPAKLPNLLAAHGFEMQGMCALSFSDPVLRPDGLAAMLMQLMAAYASQNALLATDETQDWLEEQRDLARAGRFFFSLTHFICSARLI